MISILLVKDNKTIECVDKMSDGVEENNGITMKLTSCDPEETGGLVGIRRELET